jgi:hypothetical protein
MLLDAGRAVGGAFRTINRKIAEVDGHFRPANSQAGIHYALFLPGDGYTVANLVRAYERDLFSRTEGDFTR